MATALRRLCAVIVLMALLLSFTGMAEETGTNEDGREWTAFDRELAGWQVVSQLDERFDTSIYQYKGDRFVVNGCGPATLHNGLAVSFRITDPAESEAVLLEIMTITADFQNPAQCGINYKRMSRLTEPICDQYAALTALKQKVDSLVWLKSIPGAKTLINATAAQQGSAVIMGRINLFQNWGEIIDVVEYLHREGMDDATITVSTLSSGTPSTGAPFNMGDQGHYITLTIQVGQFLDHGTIYVLDSFPRAVRGESLVYPYTKKYYFAENNKLTSFRQNYAAWHLTPTVVKCEPLPEVQAELLHLRENAGQSKSAAKTYRNFSIKLARRVTTYGTGTLFLRIR